MVEIKLLGKAVEGRNCTITCKTDTLITGVSFQHPPGIIAGFCPVPGGACKDGTYILTQNMKEAKTTLTLSPYSKRRDDGVWVCTYRRISSASLYLNAPSK